ncbi:type II toxin-antitoxin system PrlF family antitoxin [Kiloniella laminariae]|uniref:Type II toxin-antitoxin system PrlF family antitoxin n=1 Tax=Kiloniella laminariae TaxID=454162 RepID=A0ABT4LH01_9PROT|nr:type II toxin-antitoxin system PrlF family antitoxin [Kiloniella laminariae]MCZ4280387.1 type II toxin-antitoxin system PrlF family antitoxin [Kiloniella laminariae]
MSITSALTTKCQTTIPLAVRKYLKVGAGDLLQYELQDGHVVLTPVAKPDAEHHEDPFYHFTEWGGENDEEAYADL